MLLRAPEGAAGTVCVGGQVCELYRDEQYGREPGFLCVLVPDDVGAELENHGYEIVAYGDPSDDPLTARLRPLFEDLERQGFSETRMPSVLEFLEAANRLGVEVPQHVIQGMRFRVDEPPVVAPPVVVPPPVVVDGAGSSDQTTGATTAAVGSGEGRPEGTADAVRTEGDAAVPAAATTDSEKPDADKVKGDKDKGGKADKGKGGK